MSGASPGDQEGARPRGPAASGGSAIAGQAVRASLWTVGGYVAANLLRLGGNLILTRILFPEVFGLSALVSVFIQGLTMFSDVGTGPAIVQNERGDDPRFLNTAWTVQCIRGGILWVCSWLIARPVAAIYGEPLLAWLIPVSALSAVMAGFEATSLHVAQRHLRVERLTLVELANQGVGLVAMILLAVGYRSLHGANQLGAVWAVTAGALVGNLTRLVLSHTALPGIRHRFQLEPQTLRILLGFGRWVFVSTLLTFLSGQSDRLVFGRMIPLDLFGVYGIAAALAMLPTQAVQRLGNSVLFPAYSRLVRRDDFASVYGRARLPLLLAGAAVVSGLVACGPFLIRVLYDSRYFQAGWILQFLAAGAWFQTLESTNTAALLARGRVTWMAAGSATKLAGLVVLLPIGFHLGGFRGALAGLVLSDVAKYLVSGVGIARSGAPGFRRDFGFTVLIACTSYAGSLLGNALGPRYGNLAAFAGAAVVAGGVWLVLGFRYLRRERAARAARAGWSPPAPAQVDSGPGSSGAGLTSASAPAGSVPGRPGPV